MFLFFTFLLFALPSLFGRLRLYSFGLFIHLHIYRAVPSPSIPLGYVCLLLLFRHPRCSCLSCRLSSSRRVGRVIETTSKLSVSLCCYFKVTHVFFYPFILLFYRFFIFIYFILSIFFFVPVFVFPRVAFSKGNLCSLSDYRGWVCHSLGLTCRFFCLSFPSCLSMAGRRFLILILPRFLLIVHVG